MNNTIKMKTVYSQFLAGKLMMNGFVLVGIEENNNGSGKNVFFFKDSPEIERAIEQFKSQK